jgi:hypothetical protein
MRLFFENESLICRTGEAATKEQGEPFRVKQLEGKCISDKKQKVKHYLYSI